MTVGTRYPTLAFHTGGCGQADDGIPPQPFETFCYDSALKDARIENFNIGNTVKSPVAPRPRWPLTEM